MDSSQIQEELSRLTSAFARLEQRVALLESGAPIVRESAAHEDAAVPAAPKAFSGLFASLAMICFSLVGALVLRVATQQGLMDPTLGTGVGLVYCAALLATPHLGRWGLLTGYGVVLQLCAVILAPLIVLEMTHQMQVMGVSLAALILTTCGLVGAVLGAYTSRRALAVTSLVAAIFAIAALGLTLEATVVRASSILGLVTAGLAIAHARSWPVARTLTLLPAAAVLGTAVLITGRRAHVPESTALALLISALALWLIVLIHHNLRAHRLSASEAAWLPVTTVWAYGLAAFYTLWPTAWIASGVAVTLVAAACSLTWRRRQQDLSLVGLGWAGAMMALLALPTVDQTGLGVILFAFAFWLLAERCASVWFSALSLLLVAVASGVAFVGGQLWQPQALSGLARLAGFGLGTLMVLHFRIAAQSTTKAGRMLAPISLVAGLAVVFATLRAQAFQWLGDGSGFLLSQSILLALLSVAGLALGRWLDNRTWRAVGFAGMGLLALKVVFSDLLNLEGAHLVTAVITLGLASVFASVLTRKARRHVPG